MASEWSLRGGRQRPLSVPARRPPLSVPARWTCGASPQPARRGSSSAPPSVAICADPWRSVVHQPIAKRTQSVTTARFARRCGDPRRPPFGVCLRSLQAAGPPGDGLRRTNPMCARHSSTTESNARAGRLRRSLFARRSEPIRGNPPSSVPARRTCAGSPGTRSSRFLVCLPIGRDLWGSVAICGSPFVVSFAVPWLLRNEPNASEHFGGHMDTRRLGTSCRRHVRSRARQSASAEPPWSVAAAVPPVLRFCLRRQSAQICVHLRIPPWPLPALLRNEPNASEHFGGHMDTRRLGTSCRRHVRSRARQSASAEPPWSVAAAVPPVLRFCLRRHSAQICVICGPRRGLWPGRLRNEPNASEGSPLQYDTSIRREDDPPSAGTSVPRPPSRSLRKSAKSVDPAVVCRGPTAKRTQCAYNTR
jgi:hypothetical protein